MPIVALRLRLVDALGYGSRAARPDAEAARRNAGMGRLEGRVAVNTGAGRGIGRATAVRFAASAEADFISGVVLPVSGGQLGA